MRLLIVNPNTSDDVTALIRAEAERSAAPGTELDVRTAPYGVEYIEAIGGQSRLGRTAAEVFGQAVEVGMGDLNDSELIDALRKIHAKQG